MEVGRCGLSKEKLSFDYSFKFIAVQILDISECASSGGYDYNLNSYLVALKNSQSSRLVKCIVYNSMWQWRKCLYPLTKNTIIINEILKKPKTLKMLFIGKNKHDDKGVKIYSLCIIYIFFKSRGGGGCSVVTLFFLKFVLFFSALMFVFLIVNLSSFTAGLVVIYRPIKTSYFVNQTYLFAKNVYHFVINNNK